MSNEPTVNIDKFLGLYNREQSRRLPIGALTTAENVDIDDTGGIIRRQGYVKSLDLTSVTSAFSTQDERRLFVISDGDLVLVHPDQSTSLLYSGIGSDYIYWVEIADFIVLSTGHIINKDNQVTLWRIPTPLEPAVRLVSGDLPPGQYQVATVFKDSAGREGGASPVRVIDLNDNGGLQIEPDTVSGYTSLVFVTDTNGTELYYAATTTGPVTIRETVNLTVPIEAAQLGGYPAPVDASIVAYYDSRLWAAAPGDVSYIWFSEPFWWNLFALQNNFIAIPGRVQMLVGHKDGLIIGTDDEIYVYNDSLVRVAEYGVPPGRPYSVDDMGVVFIWTKQGVCSALPFQNLTEQKLSLAAEDLCYTEVVEQNGFRKFVVLAGDGGTADNKLL